MKDKKLFGVPTKILGGIASIAVVAVLAASASVAWFSGTHDRAGNSVSAATIAVGTDGTYFPLTFSGILPGDYQYDDFYVRNEGNAKADLYVQLLGSASPPPTTFCTPNQVLQTEIYDLDLSQTRYGWAYICDLYPGHTGSTIVKLADDVDPGVWKHFRVGMYLDTTAGNAYQGLTDSATVHFIAVQWNGPAPQADQTAGNPWPVSDPNYP